ncbi:MAG: PPC domain-containing protein [Deltaproteobacteria bacterium]|nr:PPC domain-containing protein [Deltaproteobacteria bacterium]
MRASSAHRFLILAVSVAACSGTVDGSSPGPREASEEADAEAAPDEGAPADEADPCAAPCGEAEADPPASLPDEGAGDEEPAVEAPEGPETAESEDNDTVATADLLGPVPSSIDAVLGERDTDFFELQVNAAASVNIETGPIADGGDLVDTVVEVFDNQGIATSLGSDDDGADIPLFSRLTVELPEAGAYTIKVTGYSDSTTGGYALSISARQ